MDYFIKLNLIKHLDTDTVFRTELALALKITERAVYNTVRRYLENPTPNCSFTKLAAINLFRKKGFTEEEIFTTQKPALIC